MHQVNFSGPKEVQRWENRNAWPVALLFQTDMIQTGAALVPDQLLCWGVSAAKKMINILELKYIYINVRFNSSVLSLINSGFTQN